MTVLYEETTVPAVIDLTDQGQYERVLPDVGKLNAELEYTLDLISDTSRTNDILTRLGRSDLAISERAKVRPFEDLADVPGGTNNFDRLGMAAIRALAGDHPEQLAFYFDLGSETKSPAEFIAQARAENNQIDLATIALVYQTPLRKESMVRLWLLSSYLTQGLIMNYLKETQHQVEPSQTQSASLAALYMLMSQLVSTSDRGVIIPLQDSTGAVQPRIDDLYLCR